MAHPSPPNARELLPPILTGLSNAFVMPEPPNEFLSELCPPLKQRLTYMTASSSPAVRSDGWPSLLSWDSKRGSRLSNLVRRLEIEPHPISGVVELDDVRPPRYRRLDEETLHATLEIPQYELTATYVWIDGAEQGRPSWKLTELHGSEDVDGSLQWHDSIWQANSAQQAHKVRSYGNGNTAHIHIYAENVDSDEEEEDDGSYWARYDMTPGVELAKKKSYPWPAKRKTPMELERQIEEDYFSRYGNEVQPALDSHDPDEEHEDIGPSTLTGDSLMQLDRYDSVPTGKSLFPADLDINLVFDDRPLYSRYTSYVEPHAFDTASPASSTATIEANPKKSVDQIRHEPDLALMAIKQHISTDIKSLFRLARGVGMDRCDFEEVIHRQLNVLCMFERDD